MRQHLTLRKGIAPHRKNHGWLGRGLTCVASLLLLPALGEVRLAPLFGDNMVLQAESNVPIWGTANPGEPVTVRTADYSVSAQAGADGRWVVRLPAMHPSESPSILIVAGSSNAVAISNVLVGDVWLCSGQSNMQKPIGPWPGQQPVLNYEQ